MTNFPFVTSFWFDSDIEVSPPLDGTHSVDVAIVGGGFAGLSAARHLKLSKPNLSVAIIEAKHIGFGASGRNAGWLSSFPPLYWLLDNFSHKTRFEEIRWTAQMSRNCTLEMEKLVEQESIDCNWTRTQHLLVARNTLEEATLRYLEPRFNSIGSQCEYYPKKQVQNFVTYPAKAALAYEIVTIQPYRLAKGLRRNCLDLGVQIFENTHITQIEGINEGIRLTAVNGATMIAEKVILATNAYTKAIKMDISLPTTSVEHTYMLATEPLSSDLIDQITRAQKPFGDAAMSFYIGRIHDKRLIWNGIDRVSNATEEDDRHLPSYNKLHAEMIRRFPALESVPLVGAWAGAYQLTGTDAPIVRLSRDNPNIILNVGYGGGSGVNMALLSGQLTTNLVLGNESADKDAQRLRCLLDKSSFPVMGAVQTAFGVLKRMIFG